MNRRKLLAVTGASLTGLAGCLSATEYTVTDVTVEDQPSPVSLGVERVEPRALVEHPARLEFTVTNTGETAIEVRNTGIWPLGVLKVVASLDSVRAAGEVLWTDRYEASEYVDATSRRNYSAESTPLVRTLAAGNSITEPYDLHGDSISREGERVVRGWPDPPLLEYRTTTTDEWESYLPTVRVQIEQRGVI
jgi:hypothetical protein